MKHGKALAAALAAPAAITCAVAGAATLQRPYSGHATGGGPVYIGVDLANGPGSPIRQVSFSGAWRAACADGTLHGGTVVFKHIPLHLHDHGRVGTFHRTLILPGDRQSVTGTLTVSRARGSFTLQLSQAGLVCDVGKVAWTAEPL
jgi:hypothetical protein